MINSKQKGKVGEREFRDKLREHGFTAERGAQHKGGPDSPDVVCSELPIHWEVKYGERLNAIEAYKQAWIDCPHGPKIPVVAYRYVSRKHRVVSQWMIMLSADHFLEIVKGGIWRDSDR